MFLYTFIYIYIYTLEVQDQTKNGLLDDPCKGFPTTNGQSLVFGLPGYIYIPGGAEFQPPTILSPPLTLTLGGSIN